MKKVFYADKSAYVSSEEALRDIFSKYFRLQNFTFEHTKNGKPYLTPQTASPLFFSVTHTKEKLFIAVANCEIGIDAELRDRDTCYRSVLKKFSDNERTSIRSAEDFLKIWTVKESVVKWLGGSLAADLTKIRYEKETVFYENHPLSVEITRFEAYGHFISVCCETNFDQVDWIDISSL